MGGGYFGGIYFGQYAPFVAAPAPPAAAAPSVTRIVSEPWPGRARNTELRRGWRWHTGRYTVQRGDRIIGRRLLFADALELALRRGGDLIVKTSRRRPLFELRRWYGLELERALEKLRRREKTRERQGR